MSSAQPKPQPGSGAIFAERFRIEYAAGSGGMGTVYRAVDLYSGQPVALKLLHSTWGGQTEADRFRREAQLLSELRHPGIVGFVSSGQTRDGQLFLAMEWLDGHDLAHQLAKGPLSIPDCLTLFRRVSDALATAHRAGIIHRDLKPGNLFLPGGDVAQAKILDFGIARHGYRQSTTLTGVVIGTPEYMAPEQARGERLLTPAVDVFSLGCLLYECLTGRPPFVSEHVAAVLVRILFEDPLPVEASRPHAPPELLALLRRLLAKDPLGRPADAAVLHQELLALGDLDEPEAQPERVAQTHTAGPATFSHSGQELLSVVLAVPLELLTTPNVTLDEHVHSLPPEQRQMLLDALSASNISAEFLAEGTLVATVTPMDSAHDQATFAARAALLVSDLWPRAVVALATGRGTLRGRTAIGEVVEQAAHLLSVGGVEAHAAGRTGVLVDTLSNKLLQGRFLQQPRAGGHMLLAEEKAMDESRLLLGKPTPCVGRDRELQMIDALFSHCRDESTNRALLMIGSPGIGKSRIRHEFVRRLAERDEPCEIILGRCEALSAHADYALLSQAIRRLCGIRDNAAAAEQGQRLRDRVSAVVAPEHRERVTIFLAELCGISIEGAQNEQLSAARQSPRLMNLQLQRAMVEWVTGECQCKPVVLILEDLQWSDVLTVRMVDHLLREMRDRPMLVLCTARPEVVSTFPGLWAERGMLTIHLEGLGSKASERLVQQVLGDRADVATRRRIVSQAEGNPLLLEELMRAVVDGQADAQPETVLAMLQARQRRLDPSARRVLRAASVLGEEFWPGGIAAVLGTQNISSEIERALDALKRAEMISLQPSSRFQSEAEYRFQNALLRDAAYGLLEAADRVLAHCAAGEYLERHGEKSAVVLAEHAHKGQQFERAAGFYVKAAQFASDNSNLEGAIRLGEQAIQCGAQGELRGAARRVQAWSMFWQNQIARAAELAEQALADLPVGSPLWLTTIAVPLTAALMAGQRERALSYIDQLIACEPPADLKKAYMFVVRMVLATVCQRIGTRVAERIMARCEQVLTPSLLEQLQVTQYDFYRHSDLLPWRQIQLAERMIRELTENGLLRESKLGVAYIGEAYGEAGDLAQGETILRTALQQNTEAYGRSMFLVHLAALLVNRTDRAAQDEVLAICNEQLALPNLTTGFVGWCLLMLARVHLLRGQLTEAEDGAKRAVEILRTAPCRRLVARAVLIEVWVQKGQMEAALQEVRAASQELNEQGRVGYAELPIRGAMSWAYHHAGLHEQARESLLVALRELLRRADSAPSAEARARYLSQIPTHARLLTWARDLLPAEELTQLRLAPVSAS